MTLVRGTLASALMVSLCAALTGSATAQEGGRPGGRVFGSGADLMGLLRIEQVQEEIELTDEQAAKVKELGEKLMNAMRGQYTEIREIEDDQQRQAKRAQLTEAWETKVQAGLGELLPREQLIRLYQVRLQVAGVVYGLNHPFVAGRLKLTDEQKQRAAALDEETQQGRRDVFSGMRDVSQEQRTSKWAEAREKLAKLRAAADEKALALLTAEQAEAYRALLGEKFELQRPGRLTQ